MDPVPTKRENAIQIAKALTLLRPRDFASRGIPPAYLPRLCAEGVLLRLGRGLYQLADAEPDINTSLAEVAKRVPHGIICLLSALRFHQITTQSPHQIWLAIAPKARVPTRQGPPLQIIRASGEALTSGVEHHRIDGVDVAIYGVAKTVADCFKYRRRVGLDVALEALRDCRRERLATMDEIWHFAEIDRVARVMRPYLEATA